MNKVKIFTLCLVLFFTFACARTPPTNTAKHVVKRYFHKYGHKFKAGDFGMHKLENISVLDIQEIHKGMAAVTAEVKLKEGPIYMVRCMLEKKTLGWRLISWEKI